MSASIDRRRFLAAAAALPLAGLADGSRGSGLLRRLAGARAGGVPDADGLPPRVIGLRTSGGNFRFDPVGLRMDAPGTLHWLNMGDFHTTTAFHADNADLVSGEMPTRIPDGAPSWHSGMLGLTAGTQFETEMPVEGVYDYFCQPHYGFGMVGRVIVGRPRGGPGTRPLDGLPDAVRENMPSVDRIMGDAGRSFEWASRLNGVLYLLANDRDAVAPARALAGAIAEDAALGRHLGGDGALGRVAEDAGAFADAVAGEENYEALVARADELKRRL